MVEFQRSGVYRWLRCQKCEQEGYWLSPTIVREGVKAKASFVLTSAQWPPPPSPTTGWRHPPYPLVKKRPRVRGLNRQRYWLKPRPCHLAAIRRHKRPSELQSSRLGIRIDSMAFWRPSRPISPPLPATAGRLARLSAPFYGPLCAILEGWEAGKTFHTHSRTRKYLINNDLGTSVRRAYLFCSFKTLLYLPFSHQNFTTTPG